MTKRPELTEWQTAFLSRTRQFSDDPNTPVRLNERRRGTHVGQLILIVTVDTVSIQREPEGLQLAASEQFEIQVPRTPVGPPTATVHHDRFVGAPHVLYGRELCLYLDPSREWDPAGGANAFFNRLWDWLADAAAGSFSARDSLYHAIGGVPAGSEEAEMLALHQEVPERPTLWWGVRRSPDRVDVRSSFISDAVPIVYLPLAHPLPYGVGDTITDLLARFAFHDDPLATTAAQMLQAAATRESAAQGMYLMLGVPHPVGGARHAAAGWIDRDAVDALRAGTDAVLSAAIKWRRVSDDRPTVSTRRDVGTHAAGFLGATVTLLGCGALGSWFAEFAARAGAARIVLADEAKITRGLLVRQNYAELDVGRSKSEALADRLRAISDDVDVRRLTELTAEDAIASFINVDFIVDATANLAASMWLESIVARANTSQAVIAQIATDPSAGSRGIVTVRGTTDARSLPDIDVQVGRLVVQEPELEGYHAFWRRSAPADQITPVRGCSIPTFRGSAADEAAIAALAASALGRHRGLPVSGAHLFALPGGSNGEPARWIDASG